jgi:hypothetical protein
MAGFSDEAQALTEAAARHDRLRAWEATGRLVSLLSDPSSRVPHETIFQLVWSGAAAHRWFDLAELIAGAAAARPGAEPATRRLHAQMLMERGFTDEALSRLHGVLVMPGLRDFDRAEALGHIGRIHKDAVIAAADAGDERTATASLRLAVEAYLAGRAAYPPKAAWLGINAVALLSRPEALAINPRAHEEARQLAREVQADVAARPMDAYADATLAECQLALGDLTAALPLVHRYVFNPAINVFALNNFHRQLTRVWRLDRRSSPGPEMVALVSAALMGRSDGTLHLSGREVSRAGDAHYEAVFGADRFDSLENYRRGLERCACVARIGRTAETGAGSGFVLPGRLLSATLDDRFVLVTNAHVVSEDDTERADGALHPSEAVVTFAALDGVGPDQEFGLTRILFSSAREDLDVTVAELSEPIVPKACYQIAPVLPVRTSQAPVRIIGHPSGRGLSLSVNELLDHQPPKLHYRTASEGGSSGSPVFNHDWKLIGLHHAGGDAMPRLNAAPGTYQANEGIWIKSITEAIHKKLSAAV